MFLKLYKYPSTTFSNTDSPRNIFLILSPNTVLKHWISQNYILKHYLPILCSQTFNLHEIFSQILSPNTMILKLYKYPSTTFPNTLILPALSPLALWTYQNTIPKGSKTSSTTFLNTFSLPATCFQTLAVWKSALSNELQRLYCNYYCMP
jgi:hypothetical protein